MSTLRKGLKSKQPMPQTFKATRNKLIIPIIFILGVLAISAGIYLKNKREAQKIQKMLNQIQWQSINIKAPYLNIKFSKPSTWQYSVQETSEKTIITLKYPNIGAINIQFLKNIKTKSCEGSPKIAEFYNQKGMHFTIVQTNMNHNENTYTVCQQDYDYTILGHFDVNIFASNKTNYVLEVVKHIIRDSQVAVDYNSINTKGWKVYKNTKIGLSLHTPPNWKVKLNVKDQYTWDLTITDETNKYKIFSTMSLKEKPAIPCIYNPTQAEQVKHFNTRKLYFDNFVEFSSKLVDYRRAIIEKYNNQTFTYTICGKSKVDKETLFDPFVPPYGEIRYEITNDYLDLEKLLTMDKIVSTMLVEYE